MSQQDNKEMAKHFYRASAADFKKIPGSPISYWVSNAFLDIFETNDKLGNRTKARQGLATGDNGIFARLWYEIKSCDFHAKSRGCADTIGRKEKWYPYNKGGEFRRWYGNLQWVVNWKNDGEEIRGFKDENGKLRSRPQNTDCYFQEGITWSDVTSGYLSVRALPFGCIYDISGHSAFPKLGIERYSILAYLNTTFSKMTAKMLNPTLHFQIGDYQTFPYPEKFIDIAISRIAEQCVSISRSDWDEHEGAWDFCIVPLLHSNFKALTVNVAYRKLRTFWNENMQEMQRLEEENNRLFIEAYGLQDELTPDVPLSEITLTCNPHYRYGGNLSDEEREARLQSDTIAELVSYAIGCMMGRYSLDREGLVYAHAGNVGFNDLVAEGAYQRFAADGDGILPLTSEHWFEDDIAARIEEFVRTVWGADTLEENLQFIADSLCLYAIKPVKKGGETARETIRRYLSTQFFKDHLKTYKKRPIYWLFSSGKEKAFECLVYLHRYNEATLPRMRTEYVTPLLGQMASRIERLRLQKADASTAEAKRLDKQIDGLTKQLAELRAFDDQLKHHADMKITLDLDDGVKVNYGKFGTLLSDVKAITGDKGE